MGKEGDSFFGELRMNPQQPQIDPNALVAIYRGECVDMQDSESTADVVLNRLCDIMGGAVQQSIAEAAIGEMDQAVSYILVPVAIMQLPPSCHELLVEPIRGAVELFFKRKADEEAAQQANINGADGGPDNS